MESNYRMIEFFRIKINNIKEKKLNEIKNYNDLQEEYKMNIRWGRIFTVILAGLVIYTDLPVIMDLNSLISLKNLILFNASSAVVFAGIGITIQHDKKVLKKEKKKFDTNIARLKDLERIYTTKINELIRIDDEHYNQIKNKSIEKDRLENLKRELEFLQASNEKSEEKSLKLGLNGKKM